MCVCVCARSCVRTPTSMAFGFGGVGSLIPPQVPETELRSSSGLAASAFIRWALSPALCFVFPGVRRTLAAYGAPIQLLRGWAGANTCYFRVVLGQQQQLRVSSESKCQAWAGTCWGCRLTTFALLLQTDADAWEEQVEITFSVFLFLTLSSLFDSFFSNTCLIKSLGIPFCYIWDAQNQWSYLTFQKNSTFIRWI